MAGRCRRMGARPVCDRNLPLEGNDARSMRPGQVRSEHPTTLASRYAMISGVGRPEGTVSIGAISSWLKAVVSA